MTNDNFLNPAQRTYTFNLDDELAMCTYLHQREQADRVADLIAVDLHERRLRKQLCNQRPIGYGVSPEIDRFIDQLWVENDHEIGLTPKGNNHPKGLSYELATDL